LRERVAKEIYYMGLEMSSMTAKKSQKLADTLNPDVVDHHVARIMQSPAFKQIAQMPDDELRALGQSDQKLMDKFFKARAKEKQNAKTVQEAKQKAAQAKQKAAQADLNKDNPNKAQQ
ncbi:MAG: hypothetical protein K5695_00980, partial [Oscillospiraceae bacterium]|nr:hypothetical protein [Oscillospiraceae bacterium]